MKQKTKPLESGEKSSKRTRRLKRPAIRIVRLSSNQKKLLEINSKLETRITHLQKERRLIKALKRVMSIYPELGYNELITMFERYLQFFEPNYHKRCRRLRKIFKLRPNVNDDKWVRTIIISSKLIQNQSLKIHTKLNKQ